MAQITRTRFTNRHNYYHNESSSLTKLSYISARSYKYILLHSDEKAHTCTHKDTRTHTHVQLSDNAS